MREYHIRFIEGLDCFLNSLYVYLERIDRASSFIFSEIWDFVYQENGNPTQFIGEKLNNEPDYDKYIDMLRKYCGIELKIYQETDSDKALECLDACIKEDKPLGFFWDTFWCPWHEEYKKMHHFHACFILDRDDTNLTCLDPIVIPRLGMLKWDDFRNGTLGVYVEIEVLDTYETPDYKEVLKKSVEYVDGNGRFELLEKFLDDFSKNFDIEREFALAKTCMYDVKFYINLRHLSGNGYLYGEFLSDAGKKLSIEKLDECGKELKKICEKWRLVLGQMVGYSNRGYTQDLHQKTIAEFEELYRREKSVFSDIKELVSKM